ncbi:2-hydroxychromene-2-carboxylate isomerase [Piscinibacter sp. XHJ-5]|uniref:2-hydroxychromene-2-carboxylate isomerase n=1 Tax=Piscinibacter sp. XHJ-5 TaxID=3037797 RepID=UPI002452942F|nr:2-hydroxychromene-2-carboxylate isomerase [Piscinibacter sp. XHJ-5]
MSLTVDYYFAPVSPWTYLGHRRFGEIVAAAGAKVRVLPVDLGGKVFPVSGGLPLSKRAPQRQAYRLVELKRFSDFLGQAINLQPRYFPINGDDAAQLIIAVDMHDGTDAAMAITGAILRAVWVEDRNIADANDLAALLAACGLPARRLDDAHSQAVHERYEADTQQAIETGVFGAPSYVIDGEIFWGQDRLDFVARRLARG